MHSLPANIYSAAAVREMDRVAIEQLGIPGYELMTRASTAALRAARARYPDVRRCQIVCGGGNNAGDGYVFARLAALDGLAVSTLALIDPAALSGAAATAYADFASDGGVVLPWNGVLDESADLLVDAMLGNGISRDVAGDFAQAVALINSHPARVLALDIATGIHSDNGETMGAAVKADLTVTFVGLKAGLFLQSGPRHSGVVVLDELGIDPLAVAKITAAYRRTDTLKFTAHLAPRPRGAHKGDFGHVLVVGGGPGMQGAARLCAEAALRSGAGRVSVATHPDHAALISAALPEVMSHSVASADDLRALLSIVDAVAFGPGLGRSAWSTALYDVMADYDGCAVWDADALNFLAESPAIGRHRIITPHPGEASRLLNLTIENVQSDRTAALAMLLAKYGGTAVLKGSGTLISSDSGLPFICTAGNPGMAAPGMGDALTGIIAALRAQKLCAESAACLGVELHARAGDAAAIDGERGMTTSDLIAKLRTVVNP